MKSREHASRGSGLARKEGEREGVSEERKGKGKGKGKGS